MTNDLQNDCSSNKIAANTYGNRKKMLKNLHKQNETKDEQITQLNDQLQVAMNSMTIMENVTVIKTENENKLALLHLQSKYERNLEDLKKSVSVYSEKWEKMLRVYESSPAALKYNATKNLVKLHELKIEVATIKRNNLKEALKKYKLINEKRWQKQMIEFAQCMVNYNNNIKLKKNLQDELIELQQQFDYSENKKNALLSQMNKSIVEEINPLMNIDFNIPSLPFNKRSFPVLNLLETQIKPYQNNSDHLNEFEKYQEEPHQIECDEVSENIEPNAEIDVNISDSNTAMKRMRICYENEIEEENNPKVQILSIVKLTDEETEKILHGQNIDSLRVDNSMKIDKCNNDTLKQNERYKPVSENLAKESDKVGCNIEISVNEDINNDRNESKEITIAVKLTPKNNTKFKTIDVTKIKPIHLGRVHFADEKVDDSANDIQQSKSEYFKNCNTSESLPEKNDFSEINSNDLIHADLYNEKTLYTSNINDENVKDNKTTLKANENNKFQFEKTQTNDEPVASTSDFQPFVSSDNAYFTEPIAKYNIKELQNKSEFKEQEYYDTQETDSLSKYVDLIKAANSHIVSPERAYGDNYKNIREEPMQFDDCVEIDNAREFISFLEKKNDLKSLTKSTESVSSFNFDFNKSEDKKKKRFFDFSF